MQDQAVDRTLAYVAE